MASVRIEILQTLNFRFLETCSCSESSPTPRILRMSSQHISIEPDEIDDLPTYQPTASTSQAQQPYPSSSSTPQPEVYGRINNVAGEVASDRRYTGGDTLDEPVSTTIVRLPCLDTASLFSTFRSVLLGSLYSHHPS